MAYLAIAVIWRFFVQGLRTPDAAGHQQEDRKRFGTGVKVAVVALAAVGLAFLAKAKPNLLRFGWSEEQKVELQHFMDAIDYYEQATELTAAWRNPTSEDWETISALLQASLTEAEQVSNDVLDGLHENLQEHYRREFLAGLEVGLYGLRQYTIKKKRMDIGGTDTDIVDSITRGRVLLDQWVTWYDENREDIAKELN
jgi:hypothetical protein